MWILIILTTTLVIYDVGLYFLESVYVRGSMVDIDILKYRVMVFHSAPSFGGYLIHQKKVNSSISINQNYTS